MKINIRNYREPDFDAIERIHDAGRRTELRLAGLEEAFLPLRIAAEREGLFEYPGLFVAEANGSVVGFAACSEDELAWLYVDVSLFRRGIGRQLAEYALKNFPPFTALRHWSAMNPQNVCMKTWVLKLFGSFPEKCPGTKAFP